MPLRTSLIPVGNYTFVLQKMIKERCYWEKYFPCATQNCLLWKSGAVDGTRQI